MSPAVQLCAGAGGILQEGERQGNSIKPFWARGEATRSLRLNGNGSNTQLILNCQRRRRSKLMHFLDNWKQMLFPKMETSKSTFNIVPCCNGVVSLGAFEACRAICSGTKWPPTNVFFYLRTLLSFFFVVVASYYFSVCHLPTFLTLLACLWTLQELKVTDKMRKSIC